MEFDEINYTEMSDVKIQDYIDTFNELMLAAGYDENSPNIAQKYLTSIHKSKADTITSSILAQGGTPTLVKVQVISRALYAIDQRLVSRKKKEKDRSSNSGGANSTNKKKEAKKGDKMCKLHGKCNHETKNCNMLKAQNASKEETK